jgi:hypothetical protein
MRRRSAAQAQRTVSDMSSSARTVASDGVASGRALTMPSILQRRRQPLPPGMQRVHAPDDSFLRQLRKVPGSQQARKYDIGNAGFAGLYGARQHQHAGRVSGGSAEVGCQSAVL